MKVIHKFKTIIQDAAEYVTIITACEKDITPREDSDEFAPNSIDWEDVTCRRCLKRRIK